MQLPLFNFFEFPKHPQLYAALRSAGPARAWELMSELSDLDRPLYTAQLAGKANPSELAARTLQFMQAAPALSERSLETDARRFASYGPRLQFEVSFISLWLNDPDTLFGEVIEVVGEKNLRAAQDRGNGVLVLPVHLGPSYVIAPVMSNHIATTTVFNRINFDEMKAATFPDLPVEGFSLDSGSAYRSGLSALRAGRAFSIFPEIDPRGIDDHHERIPFLGTTVMAPTGPVIISKAARAPMVPVAIESNGDGTFTMTYHEPIEPPSSRDEVSARLLDVWSAIENTLVTGEPSDWEIWIEFDRMLPATLATAS